MNVQPSPTSPKAKLGKSSDELERLYRDDSLKRIQHPSRKAHFSYSLLFAVLIIGFLAGILGELVFNVYVLDEESPLARFLQPNGVGTTVTQRRTVRSIGDVVESVHPALLSLYELKTSSDPIASAYSPGTQLGTALLLTNDGWAVTSKDVLDGHGSSFAAVTDDRRVYLLKNRIDDPAADLVFFRIDGSNYPAVTLEEVAPALGEVFIAMRAESRGSFEGFRQVHIEAMSIAKDVLESSDRPSRQHSLDAQMPTEYGGGPLVNLKGHIVGILDTAEQGGTRVWPISIIVKQLEGLLRSARIHRPFLGLQYIDLASVPGIPSSLRQNRNEGALVTGSEETPAVGQGSPAMTAGLRSGDVILKVDEKVLSETETLNMIIAQHQVDDVLVLTVLRDTGEEHLRVTLSEMGGS